MGDSDERPIRTFRLVRSEDVSGVSGTGAVAWGAVFPDGVAVLRWKTAGGSTAVYDSVEDVERIHGHDGKTRLEW
jgi:hypothetical protein